jgi:putative phosphoribosyl transferase
MKAAFISEKKQMEIPIGKIVLKGILVIPENAIGLVVFAHGAGSSRLSPRNTCVADILNKNGFATLLFDLLTEEEDAVYDNRFNIPLISGRLKRATLWLNTQVETRKFKLAYFGASTGSAAALTAASDLGEKIAAVVSRGGRPDLAMDVLKKVRSPTLLIVGGEDYDVVELNKGAYASMKCEKDFAIVPGATHLFEEPGALDEVARLATDWFLRHLR